MIPRIGVRISLFYEEWVRITSDQWVLDILKHGYALDFARSPRDRFLFLPCGSPQKQVAVRQTLDRLLAGGPGTLLHLLRGTQKGGRFQANPGPQVGKHIPQSTAFQDGDATLGNCASAQRGVSGLPGPDGGVPSHSHLPGVSAFPQIQDIRTFPIPGSPFWSGHGSASVYQGHGGGSGRPSPGGHPSSPLPGRLAHLSKIFQPGLSGCRQSAAAAAIAWVDHQLYQEQSHPVPVIGFSGSEIRHGRQGFPTGGAGPGITGANTVFHWSLLPHSMGLSSGSGICGLHYRSGTMGLHAPTTATEGPALLLEAGVARLPGRPPFPLDSQGQSPLVAVSSPPGPGCIFGDSGLDSSHDSLSGWGAVCQSWSLQGQWTQAQARWPINHLETRAVRLELKEFLPLVRHRAVRILRTMRPQWRT
ncbi:collagen alpha-2(IV) chain-like [Rhinatrema bivittatum]|uniref:collagen alpha-2(IV) chain-like n=1 Tax=Rhinatrema bivittatum TaxID=194408 RepID=UPI001128D6EB|nr:collagen alpha-2(IV) chain-like [Rhinatrema bivittatum]XP_029463653.1 collagen alpha-2(IV) chain-like [Rhinatrema bivittatum]XP_029463654.1 collagen alpha-2(IV) chain-like [Rhinatrema bivittatum]XP_029463655.1 collagen alpha-2(IV) chain-like [Rhinatrema bivittatum]XP_029463656.1 collagen alpha-2(IV) chain-like [Rhinatrema bivittatum]XP_029463657.1 collagen alpha-2(IV) chain-like [Rhinatrema bivittatum]XP_029463658.1 collagen alpha-2(IV) chain-like [Rhinatrema bivittatum]